MKILISICLLISAGLTSYAQEVLKGRVTDMNGEPVAYANVALLSKADSTVISGTVTDESGTYSLQTMRTESLWCLCSDMKPCI